MFSLQQNCYNPINNGAQAIYSSWCSSLTEALFTKSIKNFMRWAFLFVWCTVENFLTLKTFYAQNVA